MRCAVSSLCFLSTATASTEIYTLSLHDALPILGFDGGHVLEWRGHLTIVAACTTAWDFAHAVVGRDRKSTRLNSSHGSISYAVFCLKKKNTPTTPHGG